MLLDDESDGLTNCEGEGKEKKGKERKRRGRKGKEGEGKKRQKEGKHTLRRRTLLRKVSTVSLIFPKALHSSRATSSILSKLFIALSCSPTITSRESSTPLKNITSESKMMSPIGRN
jgi:hypothetical protein